MLPQASLSKITTLLHIATSIKKRAQASALILRNQFQTDCLPFLVANHSRPKPAIISIYQRNIIECHNHSLTVSFFKAISLLKT